jgi:hypothetical protein
VLLLAAGPALGARVRGQVVHESDPRAPAGLAVRLLGLTPDGEAISRDTRSDAQGRFRFDGLDTPAAYLTLVEYQGVGFHGDTARFGPDDGLATRTLEIQVHEPSDDPSTVQLERIRIFVEHEARGYRIDQVVELRNNGERVLLLPETAPPALRIALAPGHSELRTRTGIPPSGFAEVNGTLELRGPLFPGTRELTFSYDLPETGDELRTEFWFPDGVPELELFVLDERVAIAAGSLHPGRASRDANGSVYQRYLGFDLPAGTRLPLVVRPLPDLPERASPAAALAAALLAGGLLFFVGRPLGTRSAGPAEIESDAEEAEKEALFAALRDLEHDFETGKLSSEDRDGLREALRRDTLLGLARARRATPIPPEPRCPSCERPVLAGDNFCGGCGSRL